MWLLLLDVAFVRFLLQNLLLKFIYTPGCPVVFRWVNILQIYLSILLLMGIWVASSLGLL